MQHKQYIQRIPSINMQTKETKMDDGLNINDLVNTITIGQPNKKYNSFKEQLLDDESFKLLGGLYGKYPNLREVIEDKIQQFFKEFPEGYAKTAIAGIKVLGIPLDLAYQGNITMVQN